MKKIIAIIFLLISGLSVFLATVDLEPYLTHNLPDTPKNIALDSVPEADDPPAKTNVIDQVETHSTDVSAEKQTLTQLEPEALQEYQEKNLLENSESAATVELITTGQEHTATPSAANRVDEQKLTEMPASLIELEVIVLPVGEYPFSILLETFLDQSTAQLAIPFYQKRGISAYWVKVNLGEDGIRYRLFTGVFRTVPEAQQYLDQNQLIDKLIKGTYYSARVGVYMDKAQLASDFVKTGKTGVIPYILGTKKGDYHLYVGAFYTFIGATAQCRDLTEAGLSCEPVRRSTFPPK